MELALRVLIAATLLSSVHARAAAVQENNPPSQAQAAAARDINALVRQVLIDRIPAKDIPGLVGDAKRIAIRSDRVRLPLGQDALPALQGYELRLISTEEAQAEAERTQTIIHFVNRASARFRETPRGSRLAWTSRCLGIPSSSECCCSLVGVSPDRRPLGSSPGRTTSPSVTEMAVPRFQRPPTAKIKQRRLGREWCNLSSDQRENYATLTRFHFCVPDLFCRWHVTNVMSGFGTRHGVPAGIATSAVDCVLRVQEFPKRNLKLMRWRGSSGDPLNANSETSRIPWARLA